MESGFQIACSAVLEQQLEELCARIIPYDSITLPRSPLLLLCSGPLHPGNDG